MVKSGKNGRYVSEVYGCFSYFVLSVLSVENTEEQQPAANHSSTSADKGEMSTLRCLRQSMSQVR